MSASHGQATGKPRACRSVPGREGNDRRLLCTCDNEDPSPPPPRAPVRFLSPNTLTNRQGGRSRVATERAGSIQQRVRPDIRGGDVPGDGRSRASLLLLHGPPDVRFRCDGRFARRRGAGRQ